ncbi:TPA: type II toxin-antitoxin system VapC family toxin [Pseudomonas aeruginosa]|uniref:type II toxin-antitoxin system VapC family toxin n=1 Tax=Pseudomonas aeruginosa TaxID=287 RepID=UPI0029EE5534|nr:type II toxin-antitoxin system VapC family toxin [Pseudomonas aeruginosa]
MKKLTYMLDTNICSFIMRERPEAVIHRLKEVARNGHTIVVSAITYSEMRFGAASPKASPKVAVMVEAFVKRLDAVLPWDAAAVDRTTEVRVELGRLGTPISDNDAAIAGHALAAGCVLVTNNTREFARVVGLPLEDWVHNTSS